MEQIRTTLTDISNLLEKDNRGVQLGCYSVALIGLTIAVRKVRPFSKFKRPSDIPNHFIKERRELTGLVERIEPNGALLMIKHKPLIALPGIKDGELPVKISGVNVSGLGISWLQTIVAGSEVKFVPVAKDQHCVQCEVLLPQKMSNKKERLINVGESLIKIGFGHVADIDRPISQDRTYLTYQNRLRSAENYALKRKLGLRYYVKPTTSALRTLAKGLNRLLHLTSKQVVRLPKVAAT